MRGRAQAFGRQSLLSGLVLVSSFAWCSDDAAAQGNYAQSELTRLTRRSKASFYSSETEIRRNLGGAITRVGVAGVNRRTYGGSSAFSGVGARKPFAGVTRGPTVSPYLSLSRPFGSATDYQTLIRPMRERERERERQQIQNIRNQRRLNSLAAQAPFNIQGDETAAPTGHSATRMNFDNFQNTASYFPPPSPPKQQ